MFVTPSVTPGSALSLSSSLFPPISGLYVSLSLTFLILAHFRRPISYINSQYFIFRPVSWYRCSCSLALGDYITCTTILWELISFTWPRPSSLLCILALFIHKSSRQGFKHCSCFVQTLSNHDKGQISFFWSWSYWSTFLLTWCVTISDINVEPYA